MNGRSTVPKLPTLHKRESVPNFGERYRQGETISTAFVESTIHQVVSRRFVKKQQMQWTLRGAHLCYRPEPRFSMTNSMTCSDAGTRDFAHNRKPPRQNGKWLAPGLLLLSGWSPGFEW
jgi:hypothetical protein